MTAATRVERPEAWDWSRLADLGEQLVNTTSLAAQHGASYQLPGILSKVRLTCGCTRIYFAFQTGMAKRLFPVQPPLDGMRRVVKTGRLFIHNKNVKTAKNRITRDLCRGPARRSGIHLWGPASHAAQWAWIQPRGTGPTQRAGSNRCCQLVRGPSCGSRTLSVGANKPCSRSQRADCQCS